MWLHAPACKETCHDAIIYDSPGPCGDAACMLALAVACATNPVTGKRQLALVSEAQEIEMGRQAAQQVAQTLGFIEDDGLQALVQRVGTRLAADSERPSLPWEFHVVDDPTPNAFALPGGFIYVTRGMVTLMTSEAQLASVLGHEVGHVTARHSVAQISQQQLAQIGLGLGSIFSPAVQQLSSALGAGLQLLFLRHGRDDERQADELGFRYIRTHGYDVQEFGKVFASLERTTEAAGGSPVPRGSRRTRRLPNALKPPPPAPRRCGPQPDAIVGRETFLRELDQVDVRGEPAEWILRGSGVLSPGHALSTPVSRRLANAEYAAGGRRGGAPRERPCSS